MELVSFEFSVVLKENALHIINILENKVLIYHNSLDQSISNSRLSG